MVMGTFQAAGSNYADASAAIEAKADQINAQGGIKGRPIKVTVCDDQLNPNQAASCARDAVSAHAVAVLSPTQSSGFGAQTLPILEAAGIPAVDEPAVVPTDWTSPNSFPLDPGEPAQYAAVALALKQAGCTQVGSVQVDVPAAVTAVDDLKNALSSLGGKLVLNLQVGLTSASYASQVAQLISAGAQCVVPIIAPPEVPKLISALNQSGKKLLVGGVTAAFSQQLLTSMGSAANGILLAAGEYLPTDTSVAAVADMISTMKQYTPSVQATDTYATSAWGGATLLFSDVFPSIAGSITPATVTAALKATKNAPVGTYAPYTYAQSPPDPKLPQVRETGVVTWKVANGTPTLTSNGFINIYQALKAAG